MICIAAATTAGDLGPGRISGEVNDVDVTAVTCAVRPRQGCRRPFEHSRPGTCAVTEQGNAGRGTPGIGQRKAAGLPYLHPDPGLHRAQASPPASKVTLGVRMRLPSLSAKLEPDTAITTHSFSYAAASAHAWSHHCLRDRDFGLTDARPHVAGAPARCQDLAVRSTTTASPVRRDQIRQLALQL
jgi:hypothetical protein